MKDLIIVGAGGFGREVLSYAHDIIEAGQSEWCIKGFINDLPNALDNFDVGYPILGSIKNHVVEKNSVYICAIGDSKARLRIGLELQSKGAQFINLIHPETKFRERVKMGIGIIVCPGSGSSPDVTIGDFVMINTKVGIGHDCTIGKGVTIGPRAEITGNCHIADGVYIGAGAIIIPNRKIGTNAQIGAGAVIFTNVKPEKTMIGNPAQVLK